MKTTFGIILIIAPAVLALWPDIKKVINMVVRIECDIDENDYWSDVITDEEQDAFAIDLAFNPNFSSKLNGVSLRNIHVMHTEPYKTIDWQQLETDPEQVYIKI